MALPTEPVTVSVEQLNELKQKLVILRHDVNNNLSLMMAATELIRRRPETADNIERMWTPWRSPSSRTKSPNPSCVQFARELEDVLQITRH